MTETVVSRSHWGCFGGHKNTSKPNTPHGSQTGSGIKVVDQTSNDPINTQNPKSVGKTVNGRTWSDITCAVLKGLAYAGLGGTALLAGAILVAAVIAMFFPGIGPAAAAALAFAGAGVAAAALATGTFFTANATAFVIGSSAALGTVAVGIAILVASEFMCKKKPTPVPGDPRAVDPAAGSSQHVSSEAHQSDSQKRRRLGDIDPLNQGGIDLDTQRAGG